ncbi:MAG: hypothetical protein ACE5GQ_10600, partial [Nitrospinales bacterium]
GGVKPPGPEASPDPGWNYSPWQNPGSGLKSVLTELANELPAEFSTVIENMISRIDKEEESLNK